MSRRQEKHFRAGRSDFSKPPYIGALLRLTWQRVRNRLLEAVHDAGFTDLQDAHFAVFTYPLPDAVRPSELARNMHMSRQAANYLIAQLEGLGYLERRAPPGNTQRLVYLTARGRQVGETIYARLRQLQAEWASEVGHGEFKRFMDVLVQLSVEKKAG